MREASIESLVVEGFGVLNDRARFRASTVLSLPEKLRGGEQRIFEETGGIHSAGLFDSNGEAIFSAEDVGRHNAVDKVIGFMLMNGIDGRGGKALQVSGRAGFEIVQKAVRARISLVSSVSAPSSLAVDTALSFNLTLCGFVRQDRFNVYSGEERIEFDTVFYG
ncbi:formate dehydrogenase accessory sulfurtransferase FdhD [Thermogymnomonas acidicola]|uniref:formate dehydrogenase accessory sulfurtransferase FdhD n=1 Tax=Thermogymnomonas acidicola TaxID=399579 RepID=UPI000946325E|nr:formate dehydrogenase accessory sulfurtransferase FdhD [Thermogymnomonas acidicola]